MNEVGDMETEKTRAFSFVHTKTSFYSISVGEVQFDLVCALFGQTRNQMVQFEPGFAQTKPKMIETVPNQF